MRRIGKIAVPVVQDGGLRRSLSSGRALRGPVGLQSPYALEGKKARAFPLRFVDGAVFLGPLKVGQVPALF